MTLIPQETITAANKAYATAFSPSDAALPLPPAKELAIVTCMDARIMPASALGLRLGDAHIIRNAGGSARDALRSLVVSQQLLGTKAVMVVKHTDCGMATFDNPTLRALVKKNLNAGADDVDFEPIKDIEQAVRDDVHFLRTHRLIPEVVRGNVSGWVYDVRTGRIEKVV